MRWLRQHPVQFSILLFCLADYILESINGRLWMNDFRVYYSAAEELLKGHDIYGKAYGLGTGFYKYSPFVAIIFTPFALLPFAVAKTILFFLTSLATVLLFSKMRQIISINFEIRNNRTVNLILFIALTTILAHLVRELHLGNVNMILLFLLCSAMLLIEKNQLLAGALVGFCLLVKPHFIILLPLLLFRKQFRTLLSCFGTILVGFLIPAIFIGWQQNIFLLKEWTEAMKQHSSVLENATQTIALILQSKLFADLSTQLYFKIEIGVLFVFAIIFCWFLLQHLNREKKQNRLKAIHFQFEYIVLLAVIPSLAITDTEHFLFALPLIAFLIAKAFMKIELKGVYLVFLVIALLLYGANWHDLLGATLSNWIFQNGLLGISNVLLIALFLVVFQTTAVASISINKSG